MDFLAHTNSHYDQKMFFGGRGWLHSDALSNIIVQYVTPFNLSVSIIVQNTLHIITNFNYDQLLVCKSMEIYMFV